MSRGIKRAVYFLLAFLLAFLLNFVKTDNDYDRKSAEINLNNNTDTVITIDIADFSIVKYYLEPNLISLNIKYKNIDKDSEYKLKLDDLNADIFQGSKKGLLKNVDADDELIVSKNGDLQVLLEISIPREFIYQKNVKIGNFIIYKDGAILSECKINIINSRY